MGQMINSDVLIGDNPMYTNGFDGLDAISALMLLMHDTQTHLEKYSYMITKVSICTAILRVWICFDNDVSKLDILNDITAQTGHSYNLI